MRKCFFIFLACLVQDKKIDKKFLLASLKTITNYKNCSNISVPSFLCFHWLIFSSVNSLWPSGQFPKHRRLSEQLSESKAAIESQNSSLEGFSQLVCDFIEASRNFILHFLHKKTAKNCENHQRSLKKYCFDV